MAISSLDGYLAAAKQRVTLLKTASRTSLAATPFSVFDQSGSPGAGVLAGTSTANGVVPTAATTGCPVLTAFGGGNTGYLSKIEFGHNVASRLVLFDMLFKAGAYAFTGATTNLSSQPSYAARVPNTDYSGLEIWIEVSTAFTTGNNWQVQVTYTNQAGTAARTTTITTALTAANLILGRMVQLPLQAGDTGVQKIESVIVTNGSTAMAAGAFNVLVLRRLWSGRCPTFNSGDIHDMLKTGMPVVFSDSALFAQVIPDSTSTGILELNAEITNG